MAACHAPHMLPAFYTRFCLHSSPFLRLPIKEELPHLPFLLLPSVLERESTAHLEAQEVSQERHRATLRWCATPIYFLRDGV